MEVFDSRLQCFSNIVLRTVSPNDSAILTGTVAYRWFFLTDKATLFHNHESLQLSTIKTTILINILFRVRNILANCFGIMTAHAAYAFNRTPSVNWFARPSILKRILHWNGRIFNASNVFKRSFVWITLANNFLLNKQILTICRRAKISPRTIETFESKKYRSILHLMLMLMTNLSTQCLKGRRCLRCLWLVADDDECLLPDACPPEATCVNFNGSYECVCQQGHYLDQVRLACIGRWPADTGHLTLWRDKCRSSPFPLFFKLGESREKMTLLLASVLFGWCQQLPKKLLQTAGLMPKLADSTRRTV
jgi:hypothetical protein